MYEKSGRPRQLVFGEELGISDPGTQWMVGMYLEMGDRVLDQVAHLPEKILHSIPRDSYLSPARVVLHLVGTDLRRIPQVVGPTPEPGYAPTAARTQSMDFPTMETQDIDVVTILRTHLAYRLTHWVKPLALPGILEEPLDHPDFAAKRDLLGHLIWHWAYHSGHIGAVTLEAGYEYTWTSTPRPKP